MNKENIEQQMAKRGLTGQKPQKKTFVRSTFFLSPRPSYLFTLCLVRKISKRDHEQIRRQAHQVTTRSTDEHRPRCESSADDAESIFLKVQQQHVVVYHHIALQQIHLTGNLFVKDNLRIHNL